MTVFKQIKLICNKNSYLVNIQKKPIKSLRLKIDRDANIIFNIPTNYPLEKSLKFLQDKSNWIDKNMQKILNKNQACCSFKNGDSLTIWGKARTLEITEHKKNDVELFENILKINSRNLDPNYIAKLFYKWAVGFFFGHLNDLYEKIYKTYFKKFKFNKPQIVVKKMKSMWGNCKYNKEIITFNFYLLKTPIECVEYVILHELTHMIYHDHSANFKAFLSLCMPDWKIRKKELNKYSLSF